MIFIDFENDKQDLFNRDLFCQIFFYLGDVCYLNSKVVICFFVNNVFRICMVVIYICLICVNILFVIICIMQLWEGEDF